VAGVTKQLQAETASYMCKTAKESREIENVGERVEVDQRGITRVAGNNTQAAERSAAVEKG
jgi:hypothetical protein